MKKLLKALSVLFGFVILAFAGLAIFVSTLDADKYRPKLVQIIGEKTGRAVKLNGPIAFSLGLGGIKISIQDASIANPAWASRPNMAGMGKFELGVGLLPLLAHQVSVNTLSIENADILLETNAAGQHNWDFSTTGGVKPTLATSAAPVPANSPSVPGDSLSIGKLSITNSQLALRNATGKISSYNVASLTLGMAGLSGAELNFKGDANGAPITLAVKTSIKDLLGKAPFSFDADLTYNQIRLTASGTADLGDSKADISSYQLSSGKTAIKGTASARWGGARPQLRGSIASDHIDPADFKTNGGDSTSPAPTAPQETKSSGATRMFSDAPLPLNGLKAVDADMDLAVAAFPMGKGQLTNISAKLVLANGNLTLAPVRATVGATPVEFQLKLNAATSPAHLTVGIISNGVDLGDLQKLADMTPFMTGKASANIQLAADGDSPHALASSLGGVITITAEKGEILTGAAASISNTLATIFNPQGGNAALNCLAARFIAKGGVLNDNGILIDSTPSTVAVKGDINLGTEKVNLALNAKTKLVNIGGLVPVVQISGPLSSPGYSVDAVGAVKNVVGALLSGDGSLGGGNVPDIQTAPAGQNACVYTLDHPQKASASTVLPSDAVGKASQKIQNLGNSLVKGLFGQ